MATIVGNLKELIEDAAELHLTNNVSVFKSITPGPQGDKGDKGDIGISVHHTKGTSTTNSEGDFNTSGEKDTYTMYGDAAETLVLGWFTVQNGNDPYDYAQDGGYAGTREDFMESLSSITSIETSSQLSQWRALANEMTTDSFANEPVDVEVKIYSSNGNGTFTSVTQTGEYSALHYKIKAEESYEKALALGNSYVVANNTERNNLTLLTTADTVFVSDDGDGKWARYQVVAVTNGNGSTSTFKVIMDEDTYLHANTAAEIKATYESNDNTNVYTDSEKTKLAGIEAGATADQTGAEIKALYEAQTNKILDNVTRVGLNGTNTVGQMTWNATEQTADLILSSDVTLQLGQELLARVRNNSGSTIVNGTVVMVTGALGASGNMTVAPHDGTRANGRKIAGLATHDIANGVDGLTLLRGKIRGLDTTGSSVGETWLEGDWLFVKPNDGGKLTKIEPADDELKMPVAIVLNVHANNGTLQVRTTGTDENAFKDWVNTKLAVTEW